MCSTFVFNFGRSSEQGACGPKNVSVVVGKIIFLTRGCAAVISRRAAKMQRMVRDYPANPQVVSCASFKSRSARMHIFAVYGDWKGYGTGSVNV